MRQRLGRRWWYVSRLVLDGYNGVLSDRVLLLWHVVYGATLKSGTYYKTERRPQNQIVRVRTHPFPPRCTYGIPDPSIISPVKFMTPSLSLLIKMSAFEVLVVRIL